MRDFFALLWGILTMATICIVPMLILFAVINAVFG